MNPRERQFVRRETAMLADADHENIVRLLHVHDLIPDEKVGLVLELCQADLKKLIKSKRRLEGEEYRVLMGQLYRGLSYLHGRRIIHRDLKPANILLKEKENRDIDFETVAVSSLILKIADFGLSRVMPDGDGSLTLTARLGTRAYMAPEMVETCVSGSGRVRYDDRLDVWSAGCIAYETWTKAKWKREDSKEGVLSKLSCDARLTNFKLVSFLCAQLQCDRNKRLISKKMRSHPFLSGESVTVSRKYKSHLLSDGHEGFLLYVDGASLKVVNLLSLDHVIQSPGGAVDNVRLDLYRHVFAAKDLNFAVGQLGNVFVGSLSRRPEFHHAKLPIPTRASNVPVEVEAISLGERRLTVVTKQKRVVVFSLVRSSPEGQPFFGSWQTESEPSLEESCDKLGEDLGRIVKCLDNGNCSNFSTICWMLNSDSARRERLEMFARTVQKEQDLTCIYRADVFETKAVDSVILLRANDARGNKTLWLYHLPSDKLVKAEGVFADYSEYWKELHLVGSILTNLATGVDINGFWEQDWRCPGDRKLSFKPPERISGVVGNFLVGTDENRNLSFIHASQMLEERRIELSPVKRMKTQ